MKVMQLLLLSLFLVSCSTVRNSVVGLTSDVMHEGAYELETERSWEVFNDAIAGNLKMLEGLWFVDQDNEKLLVDLTKGYSGYAFGIYETLYLDDLYKDNDKKENKNLAIYTYSKAVSYGMKYLEEHGIKQADLLTKMKEDNGVVKLLEDELSDEDDDVQAVFYLGNALGGLINLQKKNMKMLSQLTIVKGMFDWACSKQPNIQFGACDAFYGAYEAGRPKMLGGDIEKGKEFFLNAIKKNPTALLNRVMYIQFYVIPMSDEDIYEEQSSILKAEFEKFEQSKNWAHGFGSYGEKNAALLTAIAKKRFEIIEKNKDELF